MDGGKIEIKIGLSVSDEDAAACVWLLQLYLNNNPDKYLKMTMDADGETQMRLCEKGTEKPRNGNQYGGYIDFVDLGWRKEKQ